MIKTVYVTVEALIKLFNEDYGMRLPKNTRFILTSEINKEKEQSYIADLQSQLSEKEKEIEKLKLDNKKYFTDSCRANKEIAYKLKQQNQKAIEQLEKVLVLIQNAVNLESPEYDLVGLYDAVNNQINELKGKVEDENI